MADLRGKNAIVTGASAGLGARVAKALAGEGMNVVLAARSAEALENLAIELRGLGVKALAVPTDVAREDDLKRLVERAVTEFGSIDVLVNNAGIEAFRHFHELDPADIRRTIDVNLTGTLLLTRYVLPHMVEAGRGHVINMSSTAGKYGPAYGAAYGATKAGQIAFTQSLRIEYRDSGVRFSVVCPGFATDGGVYETLKQRTGREAPWWIGLTTADAVARSVVKTLKHNWPEAVVSFPPMRLIFAVNAVFPRLGEWLVRLTTLRFLRRVGRSHE